MPKVTPATVLKTIFVSSRPLSWVNTAFPFLIAYYGVTQRIDLPLIIGTIYFLIPYNIAMYGINDVYDYESDLRNPRKGGVEGAVLDRALHRPVLWAVVVSNVPFLVYLVWVGNPLSWLVLAVSIFAVVAYSMKGLRFKEIPVLDSITSSTHFVSPAVYGVVLGGAVFTPQLLLALAAFFCWGMASHAFGAIQDIRADREAQLSSVATAIGARTTARFALVLFALSGVLLALASGFVKLQWPYWVAALAALPYLVLIWPYRNLEDERCEDANRGWRKFLWVNFIAGAIVSLMIITIWQRG